METKTVYVDEVTSDLTEKFLNMSEKNCIHHVDVWDNSYVLRGDEDFWKKVKKCQEVKKIGFLFFLEPELDEE